uniref:Putative extra macrochaetae n=1 Tax=Corethrella appendiculata TaxID=1370023 RepID=U5EV14_9DIPT
MKAITAVCQTGASVPAIANGRVSRHHRDSENAEIQMYLSKLKDLVPFMPKDRKISRLEVIQHVIDYICDLQNALESHPSVNQFDPVQALSAANQQQQHPQQQSHQSQQTQNNSVENNTRQPLGVRTSPNTILSSSSNTTSPISSTSSSNNSNNDLTTFNSNNVTSEKSSC